LGPDLKHELKRHLMEKQSPRPPRWAERLLSWYCRTELLEDLQGDLNEYFERNAKSKGVRRARLTYILDVLKFFRLYTVRTPEIFSLFISWIMLGSYIKTSGRTIVRNKLFSGINIIGLGVSMSVGLLMIAMLVDVYSYDRFHTKHDRIYRLLSRLEQNGHANGEFFATSSLQAGLAIKESVGGAEDVAILKGGFSGDLEVGEHKIPLSGYWTDGSFFNVFTFELTQGNPATVLKKPFELVLTETAAQKLFGTTDALGMTLSWGESNYTVAGIMKDPPIFSHIKFEMLGSLSTMELLEKDDPDLMKWNNIWSTWSYVLMDENTTPDRMKESLDLLSQQWDKTVENTHIELGLQPLGDIMAGDNLSNQIGPTIGKTPVRIFLALTVLVLLSACFNYTNLSVARALRRTKEVGIRKTIGALKGQVIGQFIVESVTISLLSLCFSFLLFLLLRPHFISMEPSLQELLRLELSSALVVIFILFALFIGVFAGFFPALSFSKINAVHAFKGLEGSPKLKGFSFRKALTVFQYSISIIAITATLIIFKQYQHFIHYDFGFSTANILNIRLQGNQAELLANELREFSEVQEMSQSRLVVGIGHYWGALVKNPSDPTDSLHIFQNIVDENYLPLHGYGFVAGRNFHPKATDSAENEVIVNQQVLRRFGLDEQNPDEVLGQLVNVEGKDLAIVGILKDFEYGKPTNQTGKEVMLRYSKGQADYLNVKILSQDWPATYANLERIWKKIDPVHPFEAKFYEQEIQDSFKGMEASVKVGGFLSLLVICIASLGLLGMVVFTTELRIKEISIRKVMGSNDRGLVFLLSKSFLWMLGIATAIAIPITYVFFDQILLPNIPNSLPLQLPEMTLGSLAILLLALLMTGFQALKVARSNPAEVLKSE
jgi:putative ABC transport system permease protein